MQKEEKPEGFPDTMGPVSGGILVVLGLAIIYTGFGFAGMLTKYGIDFTGLFTWFAEKYDPFWVVTAGISMGVGVVLATIGIVAIATTKRV